MLKKLIKITILSAAHLSIQAGETARLINPQAFRPYGACAITPSFDPGQNTIDPLKMALDKAIERSALTHSMNVCSHCYTGCTLRNASIYAAKRSQISNELAWVEDKHCENICGCYAKTIGYSAIGCLFTNPSIPGWIPLTISACCCATTGCPIATREYSASTIATVKEQLAARKRLLPANAHNTYSAFEFHIDTTAPANAD